VYACVLKYRSGARSYGGNLNNVYVCILYSRISARRTFTQLKWQPQLVVSVTYHPRVRRTKFYVLSSPAIGVKGTSAGSGPRSGHCREAMAPARVGPGMGQPIGVTTEGWWLRSNKSAAIPPGVINASYIASFHPRPSVRGKEP
jgi:hypothetical protein